MTVHITVFGVSQTSYQFELDAIPAVVLVGTSLAGGKCSLSGAAIGAALAILVAMLIGGIRPEMTTIITGGILFVFVLLQRAIKGRRG